MSSRRGTSVRGVWGALLYGALACAPGADDGRGLRHVEDPLLARSSALWPVVDGRVQVRVCWAPAILDTVFPVAALAPDSAAAIAAHKEWVRAAVDREWNGRTVVAFVGWGDCASGTADVRLVPIDSAASVSCQTSRGQACAEYLGKELAGGKSVYLNMLFGDEVIYSSTYQQSHPGSAYVGSQDLSYWWLPQACFEDLRYAWSTNNSLTKHRVDLGDAANRAAFDQIYQDCLGFSAIHEFGHAAGFAHELQRRDAPTTPPNNGVACQVGGTPDVRYTADTPLGPYDPQSIMNYCRTDDTPTLSAEDVEQTNLVYGGASAGVGGSAGVDGSASGGRGGGTAGSSAGGLGGAAGNGPSGGHGASSGGIGEGGWHAAGGGGGQGAGTGGAGTGGAASPDAGEPTGGAGGGGSGCAVAPGRPQPLWRLRIVLATTCLLARAGAFHRAARERPRARHRSRIPPRLS